MKQLLLAVMIFILFFLTLTACKKDTDPAINPNTTVTGSAGYAGKWTGSVTVTEINPTLCYWSGGPAEITQNWTVTGDSVKVEEIVKDNSGTYYYSWNGTIRNDTLEMISIRNINCFGVVQPNQIVVKSPISTLADRYSIQTSANYSPCPPNCLFVYHFNLSKPK